MSDNISNLISDNRYATGCDCRDDVELVELSTELDPAYDARVSELAESRSDALISNGMSSHAVSIIYQLVSHAASMVRIFTSRLHLYEHDHILKAIKNAINNKNVKINILVQESSSLHKNHSVMVMAREHPDRIQIRRTVFASDCAVEQHMVVMDTDGYRFCPNKCKTEAVASFNRPDTALNLAQQFDVMFARSERFS